jgi:hypothetical protein
MTNNFFSIENCSHSNGCSRWMIQQRERRWKFETEFIKITGEIVASFSIDLRERMLGGGRKIWNLNNYEERQ